MRSKRILWVVVALALLMVPVATWLGSAACAQGGNVLTGNVYDANGKLYPNVQLNFKSEDNGKTITVPVDARGHYQTPPIAAGTWDIDVVDKGQVVFPTGIKISGGGEQTFDIKIKISEEQKKAAEEQAAQAKQFQNLKANFDAGVAASTQATALHTQWQQATGDQRDALQSQITQACETAIQDFQLALQATSDTDSNRHIVLSRLAAAYDLEGKYDQAITYYQQAIALKPDNAGYYDNLGNCLAAVGKIDDAMAAYSKSAELDPVNAASAWRNAGISLYNAGKMQDAIAPFQKAAAVDPKNAQTWFLLGSCLMNTMTSKTEGDKIIPIIPPGTTEAFQKAVELDPKGTWGTQAQQSLDALQAMGVGIETKVSNGKGKGKS
jgi:tetratricopeptide (TPR) repeat protein